MTLTVYQGFQSCLESPLSGLKLTPPPPNCSLNSPSKISINGGDSDSDPSHKIEQNTNNGGGGGWSFLQSITNNSSVDNDSDHHDKVYVHPLVQRSSSSLSEKSLEMCTESLGSETGSHGNVGDVADNRFGTNESTRWINKTKNKIVLIRSRGQGQSFPPALTSISGGCNGVVQVIMRPHREGGRLVLRAQAVTVSSRESYFHTERSGGRLQISLLEEGAEAEEEEEEDEEEGKDKNDENVDGEIGAKISKCKDGNGSLLDWEPFWVAS